MYKKEKIIQSIVQQGVLPLFFHPDEMISIHITEALYAAGIRVIEYANRGKQALKNFKQIKKNFIRQCPDLIIGLGTVLDPKTASKALEYDADFLVSPGFSKELSKLATEKNILWIPGCMTPTELMLVHESGNGFIKIFPAGTVGSGFINSVKEVFPDLLFMPTGGVDSENMESWFRAGVSAVGMGSGLINRELMENKDFETIKKNTVILLNQIAAIRASLV
jgi:2-dehydro-3-deoxyphosphogluconate aldolase / (4S)-4-hydroxy-2-oxoglutarate aldolase